MQVKSAKNAVVIICSPHKKAVILSSDLEINDFVAMQLVKLSQILLSPLRARTHRGPHLIQIDGYEKDFIHLACGICINRLQRTKHK